MQHGVVVLLLWPARPRRCIPVCVAFRLLRDRRAVPYHLRSAILVIGDDDGGLMRPGLLGGGEGEAHDDDAMADPGQAGGGTVDADGPAAALAGDDVGFEPAAIL